MDNKGIRVFWYSIAVVFLLVGVFTDKNYIFSPIGWGFIIVGNIRSKRI